MPGNEQFFFEERDADGSLDYQVFPGVERGQVAPDIDAATVKARAASPGEPPSPFTVTAADGVSWRVAVSSYGSGSGYLVRGLSLAALESTSQSIIVIEVIGRWHERRGARRLALAAVAAAALAGMLWLLR